MMVRFSSLFSLPLLLLPLCLLFLPSIMVHSQHVALSFIRWLVAAHFPAKSPAGATLCSAEIAAPKIRYFQDYISPQHTASASDSIKHRSATDCDWAPAVGAGWGSEPASTVLLKMQWGQQTHSATIASKQIHVCCAGCSLQLTHTSLKKDKLVPCQEGGDHNLVSKVSYF